VVTEGTEDPKRSRRCTASVCDFVTVMHCLDTSLDVSRSVERDFLFVLSIYPKTFLTESIINIVFY